jgi:hypothetical protein
MEEKQKGCERRFFLTVYIEPHKEVVIMTTNTLTTSKRKNVPTVAAVDLAPWPEWGTRLEKSFGKAVEKYLAGKRGAEALFTLEHATFLASLGSTPQELHDFVEDWCELGEPSFGMALRITEVRAEYFFLEQYLERSAGVIRPDSIPSGDTPLGGFLWLPRIIAKARAKLRGEMPADMMFGCQNDRAFLKMVGIDPAQFLRVVWSAGQNDEEILEYVKVSAEYKEEDP